VRPQTTNVQCLSFSILETRFERYLFKRLAASQQERARFVLRVRFEREIRFSVCSSEDGLGSPDKGREEVLWGLENRVVQRHLDDGALILAGQRSEQVQCA
jgi:hypothetical protein